MAMLSGIIHDVREMLVGTDGAARIRDRLYGGETFRGRRRAIIHLAQAPFLPVFAFLHRGKEGTSFTERGEKIFGFATAMLTEKASECASDTVALLIRFRIDREVALGVHAHRTVADVGRTDAQQTVVHDHDLGMDHDVDLGLALTHRGIEKANAIGDARVAKRIHEADAACEHGLLL